MTDSIKSLVQLTSSPYELNHNEDTIYDGARFELNLIRSMHNNAMENLKRKVEDIKAIRNAKIAELKALVQWEYSIEMIEMKSDADRWFILYKKGSIDGEKPAIPNFDDERWSKPFRIINNVLFHSEYSHKSCSYQIATEIIPQGLLDPAKAALINDVIRGTIPYPDSLKF